MEEHTASGISLFFSIARENMPQKVEILEIDDYIDIMLKTSYDTQKAAGILECEKRLRTIENLRNEYTSPAFDMFVELEGGNSSSEKMHERLKEIFAHQEEMIFLRYNCSVSSAFLHDGMLPHWHTNAYFDLIYVYEGACQCYFRGEKVEMVPGDLLIVPPEIEHGEGIFEKGGKTLTTAIRKHDFLEIFLRLFRGNQLLYSFFFRILNGNMAISYIMFKTGNDSFIGESFDRLVKEQKGMSPYFSEMCQTIVQEIFLHILRYYESSLILPAENRTLWKAEYGEILSYISKNYKSVSLRELEKEFHYSRRQLMRIIKNLTGENFTSLVRQMKLDQAKLLLTETSFSIEKITQECGYDNPGSFSRLFREEYGVSPGEYRKNMKI